VTTQRVQTNEVQRCTALIPAFELVFRRGDNRPFALVEIGASAGLNLLWDHYHLVAYCESHGRWLEWLLA